MKPRTLRNIKGCLLLGVLVPILASILFPSTLSVANPVLEAVLVISYLAFPLVAVRLGSAFGTPFFLGVVWGCWRLAYVDTPEKDVTGLAYLIISAGFGIIGMIVYGLRKVVMKVFSKRDRPEVLDPDVAERLNSPPATKANNIA
jgi:hypothetical protein